MKRISLALLAGLLFSTPIMAQVNSFNQRGKVTGELQVDGLCIAHPALPINSKAFVVNTASGKEAEVTVIRRIAPSQNRIADLSPGVWRELGLNSDTEVRIYTTVSGNGSSGAQLASGNSQSNYTPPPPIHPAIRLT